MLFVLRIFREPATVSLVYLAGVAILGTLCFWLYEFTISHGVDSLRAPALPGSRVASRVERERLTWSHQAPINFGPIGPPVDGNIRASVIRCLPGPPTR